MSSLPASALLPSPIGNEGPTIAADAVTVAVNHPSSLAIHDGGCLNGQHEILPMGDCEYYKSTLFQTHDLRITLVILRWPYMIIIFLGLTELERAVGWPFMSMYAVTMPTSFELS